MGLHSRSSGRLRRPRGSSWLRPDEPPQLRPPRHHANNLINSVSQDLIVCHCLSPAAFGDRSSFAADHLGFAPMIRPAVMPIQQPHQLFYSGSDCLAPSLTVLSFRWLFGIRPGDPPPHRRSRIKTDPIINSSSNRLAHVFGGTPKTSPRHSPRHSPRSLLRTSAMRPKIPRA